MRSLILPHSFMFSVLCLLSGRSQSSPSSIEPVVFSSSVISRGDQTAATAIKINSENRRPEVEASSANIFVVRTREIRPFLFELGILPSKARCGPAW